MEGSNGDSPSALAWTAMQEMTSATIQNSQHPENDTIKFRKTLNNLLLTMFDQQDSNGLIKLLACITHCMEEFPQIFVVKAPMMGTRELNIMDKHKKAVSFAFTKWLISRLFQFLSWESMRDAHSHCADLLISLWNLMEMQDLAAFSSLTKELIIFTTNLIEAQTTFHQQQDEPIEIACFFNDENENNTIKNNQLNLKNVKIKVTQLSVCERLQAHTQQVIRGIVDDLTLYCSPLVPSLWTILCHHIEHGGFPLKQAALDSVIALNEQVGPPDNPQIHSYLLDCVFTLTKYMYSPQTTEREWNEMEESVAKLLPWLISSSDDMTNKHSMAPIFIRLIPRVKSTHLQKAIGDCLLNIVSSDNASKQLQLALTKLFGHLNENEWLVKSFHKIITRAMLSQSKSSQKTLVVEEIPVLAALFNQLRTYDEIMPLTEESAQRHLQTATELLTLGIYLSREGYNLEPFKAILREKQFAPHIFSDIPKWSKNGFGKFYRSVVRYAEMILSLQSWELLSESISSLLFGCLSLPWLFDASSTLDLPNSCLQTNANIKSATQQSLGKEEKSLVFPILAALPADKGSHWRINLFNKELDSKEPEVQAAAVRSLPTLLHVLGRERFKNLEPTIRNLIETGSPQVIKEMASSCGQLVCVLSGSSNICWCSDKVNKNQFEIRLICANATTSLNDDTGTVVAFLDQLWSLHFSNTDSSIRLAATLQLNHVLGHVGKQGRLLDLCISLLVDCHFDVRHAFSKCMPVYLEVLKTSGWSFENLVLHIKQAYFSAKGQSDWRLIETILLTIGNIGKVADGDLLSVVIIILLENLLSPSKLASTTACLQIREVASAKQIQPKVLFVKYRHPISQFLLETLHDAQGRGDSDPLEILNNIVLVFGFADIVALLIVVVPHFLPHLVIKASPQATALGRCLAKNLQISKRELFTKNFKNIFCHLVCNCSGIEMTKALTYVEKETDVEIGSLLRLDCQRIHNELLLRIGSHYEQVFKGLGILASKDNRYSNLKPIQTSEEMAEYLQPRFLGFLAFFDLQIQNSNVSPEEKQSAVQSLIAIIRLMGSKNITAVRIKVLTTLRIILRSEDPGFLSVCCQAWDTFVRTLGTPALGPMLSQIVVTLLPVMKICPDGVTSILNYLIIDNKDALHAYFEDLYFIPDVPELAHIHAYLRENEERSSGHNDLKTLIQLALRGVSHENLDVRLNALSKLKSVIAAHQDSMQLLILGSDLVDPLVTQLVDTLLTGCRDADPRVRNLLGQCLGELGAIDPGRLDVKNCSSTDDQTKVYASIDEDSFIVDLVCELARRVIGADDTRSQDCFSYAIQEILQLYNCQDAASPGGRIWNSFPENIQEIIAPLMHTRYISIKADWNNTPQPIYCSSEGQTFHNWIKCWAGLLTSKVCQPKASQIFLACSMAIRHDVNIALFLLPHILVYILQDGNEEVTEMIYQEILTVLKHSGGKLPLHSDLHHMSVQAVFSVLDYLRKWVGKNYVGASSQRPGTSGGVQNRGTANNEAKRVQTFLDKIPQDILASTSYKAQAHTRALMTIEAFIKNNPNSLQEQLGFLQKLYLALDEPDGIAGVITIRQETSLLDQILSHEASGQPQDALSCYERAIQLQPDNTSLHQGLLQCLMDLDQPQTALIYANGLLAQRQNLIRNINHYRVEAAWKLSSWDILDSYLDCNETNVSTWGFGIGKALAAIHSQVNIIKWGLEYGTVMLIIIEIFSHFENKDIYSEQLESLRNEQMAPLSAASMENGSYQRGYQHIMRLHMLDELEKGTETFLWANVNPNNINNLLNQWGNRKSFVQSSMRCMEPLINLRRALLSMAAEQTPGLSQQLEQEIGRCWLYSAKIARKCGHLQRAYSSLITATNYNLPSACLEQAKWHWQKGEQEQAILCLQKVLKEHYPQVEMKRGSMANRNENATFNLAWAKTKLLLARYTEESSNLESYYIIQMYREVKDINPEWEDGHFFLAQFYDRILCTTGDRKEKRGDMIYTIVKHFGTSLLHGCRYVYQSMPRMLSLWLEFGTSVSDAEKSQKNMASKGIYENMLKTLSTLHNQQIIPLAEKLPPYLFLTAFSQLISRICHSQPDVFATLKKIIAKLLVTYPQQSMWMMMAVSKSSYKIRVQRCEEIFAQAQRLSTSLYKFLSDATKLTDRFLELSDKRVQPNVSTLSINKEFRGLIQLLEDRNFSQILLPRQSSLMVTLPTSGRGSHHQHEPFVHSHVFICGIKDTVELMPSLQRPKKISLRGTDGKFYDMMCKPKDDLRKDCRLMEFNSVVNKFLLKDAESRRRRLHIRTYAVVPLNEECGLIEWVPNLSGFRIILNKIYKERNQFTDGNQLKQLIASRNTSLEQKIEIFKTRLLPRFPPVFDEWFLRSFPDPTTWYLARLAYAHTTAVMSMVGYILGLGDRHGENVLFDSSCGDTVHVDFNCLFNRGETFEWAEMVPFRLTHNMVEAMGPLGYEGIYRKSCEVTMRVMRKQLDTLMSLLKPFIHDPLLEWRYSPRSAGQRSNAGDQGEINNEKAMVHVQDIELRLKGVIKSKVTNTKSHGLPLSIEGQVNHLIQEATDIKNLSQMYAGWAAYM